MSAWVLWHQHDPSEEKLKRREAMRWVPQEWDPGLHWSDPGSSASRSLDGPSPCLGSVTTGSFCVRTPSSQTAQKLRVWRRIYPPTPHRRTEELAGEEEEGIKGRGQEIWNALSSGQIFVLFWVLYLYDGGNNTFLSDLLWSSSKTLHTKELVKYKTQWTMVFLSSIIYKPFRNRKESFSHVLRVTPRLLRRPYFLCLKDMVTTREAN